MIQCITVLSKIQPATLNQWEGACHEDLLPNHCSSRDMVAALSALIHGDYLIEKKNKYSLKYSLEKTIKNIRTEWKKNRQLNQDEKTSRQIELIQWIKASSDKDLKTKLLKLAEDDTYQDTHGETWEILSWLLDL